MDVVEYTDAMCSWAWGTEPKLRLLHWRFDDQIESWRHVVGHLVEDEYMPDRDRVADAARLGEYWKVVCDQTGMPRPAPLQRAPSGSRASGLAVKAAQEIGHPRPDSVLRALREATFVYGEPPDTIERALEACGEVIGLDTVRLAEAIASDDVAEAYRADAEETRSPNEFVLTLEGDRPGIGRAREAKDGRMRFVFPTLVIGTTTVPGWMPYEAYEDAVLTAGAQENERTRSKPTPSEAFARWPTLAEHEFRFLCGPDADIPERVEARHWDGGTLFVGQS